MIVIVYNDALRLPTAVRSVLDQTMHNVEILIVDDGSTDGTEIVGQELAAACPDRIRMIRLPENSGGGGRPRNVGVQHAHGTHVMFLDSDDTLDRHACHTLFIAAVRTGADLVSGLCVQIIVGPRPGKQTERPWFRRLYSAWAEYDSLADNPDLMYDTLSTNKCYRLAFLEEQDLRFPEGLPHEDLLFATQAYLAAKKIVVTPHRVYNWYIHQRAVKKSVSSRRHEIRHFVDRLVIHRMLDEVLREHGDGELQLHKDIKFVNHDLRLYMAEYALRDPAYQREFRELAREYLGTLDPRALGRCKRPQAIAAFLILMEDQEGLVAISDYLGARGLLSTDLVEHGGRVYWCDRHLETEEGRRLLDVTSFGLHSLPLAQLRLSAVVTSFTIKGSRVHLCGEVGNPLGRLSSQEEPEAVLEFRSRRRRRKIRVPVTAVCHTSTRIRWEAGFSLVRRVGFGLGDRIWDIRLRLTAEGATVVCPLSSLAVDYRGHGIPVRPMFGLLPANRLEPYVIGPSPTSRGGNLGFRLVPRSLAARAVHAMARRLSAVSSCRPRRTRTPGPA